MNWFGRLFDARDPSADMNLFLTFLSVMAILIIAVYYVIVMHNAPDYWGIAGSASIPLGTSGAAARMHGNNVKPPGLTPDPQPNPAEGG